MKHYVSKAEPMEVVNAWKGAKEKGRIASLCEVAEQRLVSDPKDDVWRHVNTRTFEYCGFYKGRHPLLVVPHYEGLVKGMKDYRESIISTDTLDFGRISQRKFDELVSGKYIDVHTIDLKAYSKKSDFPFIEKMKIDELFKNELFKMYYLKQEKYIQLLDEKLGGANFCFEALGKEGFSLFSFAKMLGSSILSTPIVRMVSMPEHLGESKDVLLKEKINYLRPAFVGLCD